MNFTEALAAMKDRKYVKRAGWTDGYCCIMPHMLAIWKILHNPTPNAGMFQQSVEDLEASDWELI
jgi:hypothetical protein